MYLTLKDALAQLKAVLFRGVNLRMKFEPKDGLDVLARGRLTVYEPRGDYQFQIEELHPRGVGAAELTHVNLYDRTVEGLRLLDVPAATVQYHPEAGPGPHDSLYLFDRFLDLIAQA